MQQPGKPYHLFKYQNNWYVIDIEGMSSAAIDETSAAELTRSTAQTELYEKNEAPDNNGERTSSRKHANSKMPPIVNMSLLLTQSCNLRCVYCYGKAGFKSASNMEEKTAFRAVDWMIDKSGEIKKLHISFFGGEPLINFELMRAVVEYSEKRVMDADKRVAFHVTTNATLLDDEKLAFLNKHQIEVMVSFDGPKAMQDAQRPFADGRGSYDAVMPKIKNLLAAMPETFGHAVAIDGADRGAVKKAMQDIGFTKVTIAPASPALFDGNPEQCRAEWVTDHLLGEREREAAEWLSYVRGRDIKALQDLKIGSVLYQAIIALLHNRKKRYACGAGRGLVAVAASGDVYLCHRFVGLESYRLGNVFEGELQREAYQLSPLNGVVCGECFARYYCAGGCKYENAGYSGSISISPEHNCRLKRRELELAAAIIGSLDQEGRAYMFETEILPPKPCPFDF